MLIRRGGGGRCASRGKQEGANLDERHGQQAPSIHRAHKPAFVQEFGKNYQMRNRRQLGSLVRHFFFCLTGALQYQGIFYLPFFCRCFVIIVIELLTIAFSVPLQNIIVLFYLTYPEVLQILNDL